MANIYSRGKYLQREYYTLQNNFAVEWLAFLFLNREVPGPNIRPAFLYSWISSVPTAYNRSLHKSYKSRLYKARVKLSLCLTKYHPFKSYPVIN